MGQAVRTQLNALGENASIGPIIGYDREDIPNPHDFDAVIDFSTPSASLALAMACAEGSRGREKPLVHIIGTTGFDASELEALKALSKDLVIIQSGNFSIGINLLLGLIEQAAERLGPDIWDIEVFEAHHRHKRDAPSGTALMLGEAAASGRGESLNQLMAPPYLTQNGPRMASKIGFAVQRGGGIIGDHALSFISDEESITLSHRAHDRSLFARGAVQAALFGLNQPAGFYTMRDVLRA